MKIANKKLLLSKTFLLSATVSLLLGCATTYQSKGFSGGFNEVQLDKNVWKVTFNGNGFTSKQRAEDLAMLRSAELTLKSGYRYFAFVATDSSVSNHLMQTPSTSYTTINANRFGNTLNGTATTNTYGGNIVNIRKPSTTNTVFMTETREGINGMSYDAMFICQSLGKTYEVSCLRN
jgi:hypothetical protein